MQKKKKSKKKSGKQLTYVRCKLAYFKYHRKLFFLRKKVNSKSFLFMYPKNFFGFNSFFFVAKSCKVVTAEQIETCIKAIKMQFKNLNRKLKRNKLTLFVYPAIPKTEKGVGSRMGKGKGGVENWVQTVSAGRVLFSIKNINKRVAFYILRLLKWKTRLNICAHYL